MRSARQTVLLTRLTCARRIADRSPSVEPHRAFGDLALGLAVGRAEAERGQRLRRCRSPPPISRLGRSSPAAARAKVSRRSPRRSARPPRPWSIAVASVASAILASLIAAPCKCFERVDLVERQIGEQFEEPADIGVGGVAPELPIIVGAQLVGVEPHRAARGLAHLAAVGGGDQRRGQAEQLGAVDPPRQARCR